jgi:asparagine synthase (glutamine-hydrolysing)
MIQAASGESGAINQAFELIHGIPLRDPTAYRPLVEFCLGIPDEQFVRGGVARRLARGMLAGKIPDAVLAERRIGVQCADWHVRLGRDRAALRAELDRAAADAGLAQVLDTGRLGKALDAWPDETPSGAQRDLLQLALPRALTTARFIRSVHGTNA